MVIRLRPVKLETDEFDLLEKEILRAFRKTVYGPILKLVGVKAAKIENAKKAGSALKDAIRAGKVNYRFGAFFGRFSAAVSKEIKTFGATWDPKAKTWRVPTSLIPKEIRDEITASNARWEKTIERIDKQLRQILPANVADKVNSAPLFDSSLWKTDRKIDNTLKSISVLPELTPERRKKIADDWRNNLDKYIKDFAAEEIPKLRDEVQKHVFSGNRFEDLVKTLQKSYGVTQRKAHFLARQETNLLLSKFKEARYTEAGINEYEWNCVVGSPKHPVRPAHLALKGKIFRFDDPPVTTMPGEPERRNNPGEDYNCRCFARPIVRAAKARKRK